MTEPFDQTVADELLKWIADGGQPSRWSCIDGNPSLLTITRWRRAHPEFDARYREALDVGHDVVAEEILGIADEEPRTLASGQMDSGQIAWAKLRIDTRLKLLSKTSRKYGDRVQLTGDAEHPVVISDAERSAKVAALIKAALDRYNAEHTPHLHDHATGDWDNVRNNPDD